MALPLRLPNCRSRVSGAGWMASWFAALVVGAFIGWGLPTIALIAVFAVGVAMALAPHRLEALFVMAILALLFPSFRFADGTAWTLAVRWAFLAAVLLVLAARVASTKVRPDARSSLPQPLVVLPAFALMTTAWSVAPTLTAGRAVTFAAMISILLLIPMIDGAPEQMATSLRVVAAIIAVGGLFTLRFGVVISGRYSGVFANPNALGTAAALLFPFALQRAMNGRRRLERVANALVGALLVGEAAAAASRGGLLAAAAAYLYIGWTQWQGERRGRRLAILILPVVLAVVASITVIDPNRLSPINSRSPLWGLFPGIFLDSPFIGHGFGTSQLLLRPFSAVTGYLGPQGVDFHNSYFNLLGDLGVVGGILFAMLLARAALRRRYADPALAAVVASGAVSAIFESWLLSVGSGFAFVFWFAVAGVASAGPVRFADAPELARAPLQDVSRSGLTGNSARSPDRKSV